MNLVIELLRRLDVNADRAAEVLPKVFTHLIPLTLSHRMSFRDQGRAEATTNPFPLKACWRHGAVFCTGVAGLLQQY